MSAQKMSNGSNSEKERRALIEQAFLNVAGPEVDLDTRHRISSAAVSLARMTSEHLPYPNAFRVAGRTTVKKELGDFVTHARALKAALKSFHRPTISKLGRVHIMRHDIDEALKPILEIAEIIETIDVSDIPETPKKGKSAQHAGAVAAQVLFYFVLVIGAPGVTVDPKDNKTKGKFAELLEGVFQILEVQGSAVSQAQIAVRRWKRIEKGSDELTPNLLLRPPEGQA